jgi:hypothetical protein
MNCGNQKNELLIDQDCPMCNLYGSYLESKKIVVINPYQSSIQNKNILVDYDKAKNQIALIKSNNEVCYGVDALLYLFNPILPRVTNFFSKGIPYRLALKCYNFISYNRKVIAPSKSKFNNQICAPNFVVGYRWAYIFIATIIAATILYFYSAILNDSKSSLHIIYFAIVLLGQLMWQSHCFYDKSRELMIEYFGNLITVSLIGGLILIPALFLQFLLKISSTYLEYYFTVVILIMLYEHVRRCKILEIELCVSISWMVFMVIVFYLL